VGRAEALSAAAPLGWLSLMGGITLALIAIGLAVYSRHPAPSGAPGTWDCGYARPTARMQYTASSFAQVVVDLFAWAALPRTSQAPVKGLFPGPATFHRWVPDLILDRLILPVFAALSWACSWFRLLQRGKVNAYLLYIFITLLVLLLWK
jgi:hydrogenase-4 component B